MTNTSKNRTQGLELLAPAGSLQAFAAAVDQGADAVYIGAPALNARALAKTFSWEEIAAMISHAHGTGVKVYAAMNSLLKEVEIPQAVECLAMLEGLAVDGLILQDLGVYHLARNFFPRLPLHASTLMTAHNSPSVRQLAEMGFKRVVLARELGLAEIEAIGRQAGVELEVFVHGAMCFSYSGLCLFSSYQGGKSGLRGRCVQPCRRKYTWTGRVKGPRSGYFFSMNDLCGLELLGQLQAAGVRSLKIEGRMRSAQYVGTVVRAYRTVLDGPPGDQEALAEARALLQESMGRKETSGYFLSSRPADSLSPHHSGNIGLFLGKVAGEGRKIRLTLREPLQAGDRLRLHQEHSGERTPFTLHVLRIGGRQISEAPAGSVAELEVPVAAAAGDSLYKVVDRQSRQAAPSRPSLAPGAQSRKVARLRQTSRALEVLRQLGLGGGRPAPPPRRKAGQASRRREPAGEPALPWWLKIDDLQLLRQPLPQQPERLVVRLSRQTLALYLKSAGLLKPYGRRVIWALPPVIEEAELPFFQDAVIRLAQRKYLAWQLGHLGQLQLFRRVPGRPRFELTADYTFNALNSLTLRTLQKLGIQQAQLSVETDRSNLVLVAKARPKLSLGLTAYGRVPLFTARLAPDFFQFGPLFTSPRGEAFQLVREESLTLALADKPFSLLERLPDLQAAGLDFVVVDLSHQRFKRGERDGILRLLARPRKSARLSSFNYQGELL